MKEQLFGTVEAGGTKFVCAICNRENEIIELEQFPTETPEETLKKVLNFFSPYKNEIAAIGIGSFGPIDIEHHSETYGYILKTPKSGWSNVNFLGKIKKEFQVPIAWTTDVNAAAFGELKQGAAKNKKSCVYFTIGTGIGAGAIQNDFFMGGFSHPEMGHMLVQTHTEDHFKGNCPYHSNCLEGMASGLAIEKRLNIKGQDLPENHDFWKIQAYYLAQCAFNTTLMLRPEIIVFGGGVMNKKYLIELVKIEFSKLLNSYVDIPKLDEYIVKSSLNNRAGIIGCNELAKKLVTK